MIRIRFFGRGLVTASQPPSRGSRLEKLYRPPAPIPRRTVHNDPVIFVITGPPAAGKTTVAHLLAEKFERSAHVEGDIFRRSIVAGRHEMTPEAPPEALAQLRLRYRLATVAADTYFAEGLTVVVEDVIGGPLLSEYVGLIRGRPLHVTVLLPSVEVIAAREASRESAGYARWSVQQLHDLFAKETPHIGLWLDTSDQSPTETVAEILARAASAKL